MGSKSKTKAADAEERFSSSSSLADTIIDTIRSSSDNGKSMELKSLRKTVLHITHPNDADEKSTKKIFKSAVQALEGDGRVSVSADGIVKLSKAERTNNTAKQSSNDNDDEPSKKRKDKKKKKDKRKERDENEDDSDRDTTALATSKKLKTSTQESNEPDDQEDNDSNNQQPANTDNTADNNDDNDAIDNAPDKHKPCKGNPNGITRLFLGNLPFAITDSTLNDHLNSTITHIKWITDKETGRFYGSAFCEVKTSVDAARAVSEINGSKVMGRPIKINYAPIKPGQENDWPPKQRVITGGKLANNNNNNASSSGQAGGTGVKAMSVKPEGCCKLFIGNLSYDLDDDGIHKFFMSVDAEIKSVRWLHHKDSGDFKGCGYVDFWNTEACDKAASLNGKNLLGRPIRIDWAE